MYTYIQALLFPTVDTVFSDLFICYYPNASSCDCLRTIYRTLYRSADSLKVTLSQHVRQTYGQFPGTSQ